MNIERERRIGRAAAGLVLALVSVGAFSCASGAGRGGGSGVKEILRLSGSTEPDPPGDGSEYFVVDTVQGTPERVFNAVRYTYEALGLRFSYYDADKHEIGGFAAELGELDKKPPSAWMDCGEGAVAGNNADSYSINLTVGSRVLPLDSTHSTVGTVIRARSRQRDHSSTVTRCVTRRTLEERITAGARELLKRYGPGSGQG